MFLEEALRIQDILRQLPVRSGQIILDIGSGTEFVRRVGQPYIDYYVFRPLRKSGATVLHLDFERAEGVDIVLDISNPGSEAAVNEIQPADIIVCASLLEHVSDRDIVLRRIKQLIKPGGVILITVPCLLEYHPTPIDTMYRPSNRELEALFEPDAYEIIVSEIIEVEVYSRIEPVRLNIFLRIIRRVARELRRPLRSLEPVFKKSKISLLAIRKK